MDAGRGEFEKIDLDDIKELAVKNPTASFFHVGEEIKIKNSLFRVKSIKPKELRLKLLTRYPVGEEE